MLSGTVADVDYMARSVSDTRRTVRRLHTTDMITRDLLGESSFSDYSSNYESSHELLDVHLHVPSTAWPENCLHLIKSGKVNLQKCSRMEKSQRATTKPIKNSQDTINNLDLNYSNTYSSTNGSHVCTLDKVKSALQRQKHDEFIKRKFPITTSNSLTSSSNASMSSSTSSSCHGALKLSVAGCYNCLMYVMISNDNPNCPNCNSSVSLPVLKKRHRIELELDLDLNL